MLKKYECQDDPKKFWTELWNRNKFYQLFSTPLKKILNQNGRKLSHKYNFFTKTLSWMTAMKESCLG
jgi:hypothetical protein